MEIREICETYCRYEDNRYDYNFGGAYWSGDPKHSHKNRLMYQLCNELDDWIGTPVQEYIEPKIREHLKERIDNWEYRLTTSPRKRKYHYEPFFGDRPLGRQNAIRYGLENYHDNYVFVLKEEEAYGKRQFIVALNNDDWCIVLPPRKAFQELEVGHFYRIKCTEHIDNGRWQEYKYDIEEVDEEIYMKEGIFWERG